MQRFLHSTFCDDIRQEVGGKLSFIGIYSTTLIAQEFPVTLPKFCVSIVVVSPVERLISALTIRIRRDDEVMYELAVDEKQLANAKNAASEAADDGQPGRVQLFHFINAIAPMKFEGPCKLRVSAQTEDEEIRGLGLQVMQGIIDVPKH